jgi:hypothetical protein
MPNWLGSAATAAAAIQNMSTQLLISLRSLVVDKAYLVFEV